MTAPILPGPNREAWLRLAYARLRRDLLPDAPEAVTIAWSLPSRGGTGRSRRRITGQCWAGEAVRNLEGELLILISPTIDTTVQILSTELHEMIHCAVGVEHGHRRPFSLLAADVGFRRPWTQTPMGPRLHARLDALAQDLPAWPGGFLLPTPLAGNRHLKAVCRCEPPRILRVSRRCLGEGAIFCSVCSRGFELSIPKGGARTHDHI
ncbi:MAG: hypothetical protein A3F84_20830 [Candidatus Handelsmanbacteria bacterium RIFCSPLOWO2_12_FULL_64_10]|uniref:SprT-like domain-containing protein n=1 Tax=Handelsmanbacteria sp. (strain RIFCSPLOWO2_12_FULL_64_10) TaxID=1817868 RepID=A0A1F6D4Y3_HANXR|nr:MAG: hypothetical protein A3F84_20830 [Candidatus Handelsmanbacteria bacterium RIFCSPLOWO2_12_FULL_64_10]